MTGFYSKDWHLKRAVKPLFAARTGVVFSLALRGKLVAAGAGAATLDVDRVRQYPGGRWLDIDAREVELTVPLGTDVTGFDELAGASRAPVQEAGRRHRVHAQGERDTRCNPRRSRRPPARPRRRDAHHRVGRRPSRSNWRAWAGDSPSSCPSSTSARQSRPRSRTPSRPNCPSPSRQIVVVDDGSTDGTREFLASSTLPDTVHGRLPRPQPRQGRSRTNGPRARRRGVRRDPRRRPRVPRRRPRPRPRATRFRRSARRLRNTSVDVPIVVQLLVRDGKQGGDDGDERPLQLLDLGRHDVPQGDADRPLPLAAAPRARVRDRARDRRASAARRRADPRGADLLQGTRPRGGQEAHRGRRASRSSHARALPRDVTARIAVAGVRTPWSDVALVAAVGLDRGYCCDEIRDSHGLCRARPACDSGRRVRPERPPALQHAGWATDAVLGESPLVLRLWSVLPFLLGVAVVTAWLHRRIGALSALLYPLPRDCLAAPARHHSLGARLRHRLPGDERAPRRSARGRIAPAGAHLLRSRASAGTAGSLTLAHFTIAFIATVAVLLVAPGSPTSARWSGWPAASSSSLPGTRHTRRHRRKCPGRLWAPDPGSPGSSGTHRPDTRTGPDPARRRLRRAVAVVAAMALRPGCALRDQPVDPSAAHAFLLCSGAGHARCSRSGWRARTSCRASSASSWYRCSSFSRPGRRRSSPAPHPSGAGAYGRRGRHIRTARHRLSSAPPRRAKDAARRWERGCSRHRPTRPVVDARVCPRPVLPGPRFHLGRAVTPASTPSEARPSVAAADVPSTSTSLTSFPQLAVPCTLREGTIHRRFAPVRPRAEDRCLDHPARLTWSVRPRGSAYVAAYAVLGAASSGRGCIASVTASGPTRSSWSSTYVRAGPREILAGRGSEPRAHGDPRAGSTSSALRRVRDRLPALSAVPFVAGVVLVTAWLHTRLGPLSGVLFLFLATVSPLAPRHHATGTRLRARVLRDGVLVVAALEARRSGRSAGRSSRCARPASSGAWTLPQFGIAFVATRGGPRARPARATRPRRSRPRRLRRRDPRVVRAAPREPSHRRRRSRTACRSASHGSSRRRSTRSSCPALIWIDGTALVAGLVWLPLVVRRRRRHCREPARPRSRRRRSFLGAGPVATILVLWIAQAYVIPRYLSYLLVPLFVLLATGAASITRRSRNA